MQNQKLAHLVVASSWRPACLPSPPSRGSVVASSETRSRGGRRWRLGVGWPRRLVVGGGGHRPGKAPGGTEGGQDARRQEPRRGEALES